MKKVHIIAGAFLGVALGLAMPASAHTDLVKSSPAADSTIAAPKIIVLTFSEKITPAFSGFDLAMDDGMKATAATAVSADGKTVTLTPRGALMAGAYKLNWHAAAAEDGHKTEGVLSFKVK